MDEETVLAGLARQLREEEEYFSNHRPECLQAFIRDGGKCVYCHAELFKSYDTASATDHLVPRARLRKENQLGWLWDVRNLVASCAECNALKREFDPLRGRNLDGLCDEGVRRELILRAHEKIEERKKAAPDWKNIFERARVRFQKATQEYRSSVSGKLTG